jgi:hypothetical protein
VVDWSTDLYDRCTRLQRTSAALRDKSAALQLECAYIQVHATGPIVGEAVYTAPPLSAHGAAMESLKAIRAMLDAFPLEWQVAMVKALTARTIVLSYERTRPPPQSALSA